MSGDTCVAAFEPYKLVVPETEMKALQIQDSVDPKPLKIQDPVGPMPVAMEEQKQRPRRPLNLKTVNLFVDPAEKDTEDEEPVPGRIGSFVKRTGLHKGVALFIYMECGCGLRGNAMYFDTGYVTNAGETIGLRYPGSPPSHFFATCCNCPDFPTLCEVVGDPEELYRRRMQKFAMDGETTN